MKYYHGTHTEHGCAVVVEEDGQFRALDPRLDLRRLSMDGFHWGLSGSGPAQLALALAADVSGDDRKAEQVYQRLKFRLIGGLPAEGWVLSDSRILGVIEGIEREQRSPQRS